MRSITPTHAIWRLAGVLLAAALLPAPARAADDTGLKVDSLALQDKPVQAVPDVLLRPPGLKAAQRQTLSTGQALPPGTELTLPRGATAVLLSRNDNRITLFPGTVFIVGTVTDRGESHQPVAGKAEFDVRRALDFFNVSYARFTAAVKGTVWSVDISPASQTIAFDVREGWVEVEQRVPVRLRGGSGTDDNDDDTQAPQGAEVQLVDDLAAGQQRRYDLGVERYLQEFGNFGEAEASYRQALADAEAGGSPQRLHRALANLMAIAYTLGRPQIAIDLGPRCEDAARATRLPQAMQACDNAVGNALGKLGRHREALAYHQRVLDAERARPSGRDGTWTAAALNNLAIGDRGLGQIGRAVQLQQESVQMRQRLDGGRDSIELARVTGNLAGMQRLVGALPQSVTLYGQAIEMVQRLQNGAPHPLLANLLADLGMAQLEQGDLVAAMARLQDALRMNEQLFPGREHLSKAQCIAQIGYVLLREGQLSLAQARLEESPAMRRRLLGTIDHPAIATNLGNLGAVLRAMKRPADALPLQEQALAMRRRLADNRDHQAVATSMANLALARADAGQLPGAVALLQQSIAMFQAVYGAVDHPDIARQLHNLGSLQMRQRRPADAAASYGMSAAMLGRLAGDRPGAALAAALAGQSRAELEAGHADRALALQSEALRLREALQGGQPHRQTLLSLRAMADLSARTGRDDDARSYHSRAEAMQRELAQRAAPSAAAADDEGG
ncbi:MAG TPA: tetratricopeptide repeat protein [Aquabacterium sp.]|nr:tetratricopeptide repeat protein [Aquabacterium sp.]HQC94144.1 tetratricopeptide repeat protein [Aquabacterium sp.]